MVPEKRPDGPFPPPAPIVFSSFRDVGRLSAKQGSARAEDDPGTVGVHPRGPRRFEKRSVWDAITGNGESLREVMLLCSQPTGGESKVEVLLKQTDTFPLPTRRELLLPFLSEEHAWTVGWLRGICIAH